MAVQSNPMPCPHCGKINNAQTGHGNIHPEPGDLSICWGCRKLAMFALTPVGMQLRLLTEDEQREAEAHPEVRVLLEAAAAAPTPGDAERQFQSRRDEWAR